MARRGIPRRGAHPADRVHVGVFGGAGPGVEAGIHVEVSEGIGPRLVQHEGGIAAGIREPRPQLIVGCNVVVVAGHHCRQPSLEPAQRRGGALDVPAGHRDPLEEVAGDHQQVAAGIVRRGDDALQARKPRLDEPLLRVGVAGELHAEVQVGAQQDPHRPEYRRRGGGSKVEAWGCQKGRDPG